MLVRIPLLRALACAGLALSLALPAMAEQSPAADAARIQSVRDKLRTDRKSVVLHNLKLDAAQTAKFTPIYDAYAAELNKLNRELTRMVVAAVNSNGEMTGPQAKVASKDYLSLADAELKLLRKYHPRVVKAVGEVAGNRFLQVEDKIHALSRFDIAWATPLSE
ncbi:hypothetical protein RQP53_15100 [Paucibacter sp. APW11]|uniref:Uncharacterized protein n=1 Tax=Roseateles aquae TaxID=3077235 RepID=A0ABU3PDB9_9BURK|nr:hypothetical protein [Paucibacter sp. APW11]MDT9000600.1 hypothetical protein [Paucibacter sp. APW11]